MKIKPLVYLILLKALIVNNAYSQCSDPVTLYGGSSYLDIGYDITVDNEGYVYLMGIYGDTLNFGGEIITRPEEYGYSGFLFKLDCTGNTIWSATATGAGEMTLFELALDYAGNVIICGTFEGIMQIGDSTFNNMGGTEKLFIASYSTNGGFNWAQSYGSIGRQDQGLRNKELHMVVDSGNNIIVAGKYQPIYGTVIDTITLNTCGDCRDNIFFAKFNESGDVMWVQSGNSLGQAGVHDLDINLAGNYIFTGYISSEIEFNDFTMTADGTNTSCFLAEVDSEGNFVHYINSYGSFWIGEAVTCDSYGNTFLAGSYGPDGTISDIPLQNKSTFIIRYDINWQVSWYKNIEGLIRFLSTDPSGNIYLAGKDSESRNLIEIEHQDLITGDRFIAKYDSIGNLIFAKLCGYQGYYYSFFVDHNETPYITGTFSSGTVLIDSVFNRYTIFTETGDTVHYCEIYGDTLISEPGWYYNDLFLRKFDQEVSAINDSVIYIVPDNLIELNNDLDYKIYPVPFNNFLIIELNCYNDQEEIRVNLYNSNGLEIYSENFSSIERDELFVETSSFPSGIYLLSIIGVNDRYNWKIVKK